MKKEPLFVCIIIDVEEEGLFTGHYPRFPSVENTAFLPELAFLTTECHIPLTLVCSHAVFSHAPSCHILERMRSAWGAEIGAHLHYWSTPPHTQTEHVQKNMAQYTAAKDVPSEALRHKFHSLFSAAEHFCGHPVHTFRMGRWDMAREIWPILKECGVRIDSSIRPWQYPKHWRDHFLAPTQPYACFVDGTRIVEIPDTAVPLPAFSPLQTLLYKAPPSLLHSWHRSVVMAPNPVYHSLFYMKTAAKLLLARGERVLTLTWHSSEIMPGATPHLPNTKSVDSMLLRVRHFLHWLHKQVPVHGVTLNTLVDILDKNGQIAPLASKQYDAHGDWHP